MLNIKQLHQQILKEKRITNQEWEEEQKSKLLNAIAIKSDRKLLNIVFDVFREKEIFEYLTNLMLQEKKVESKEGKKPSQDNKEEESEDSKERSLFK